MPAKLGPDGKPIVIPTKPFESGYDEQTPTAPYDPNAPRRPAQDFDDHGATEPYQPDEVSSGHQNRPTVNIPLDQGASGGEQDDETRVFRAAPKATPQSASTQAPARAHSPEVEQSPAMRDPPVGWLVVTDGPGQGEFVTLGHGQNTVGRSGARASLNFGDNGISRESHIIVIFDPQAHEFFAAPGMGKSIGYLNDAPILGPTPLNNHDTLRLGATTLRFVALCSNEFFWE